MSCEVWFGLVGRFHERKGKEKGGGGAGSPLMMGLTYWKGAVPLEKAFHLIKMHFDGNLSLIST